MLPNLATDFTTSISAAQLTMTVCLTGPALGQLLAGPVSDCLGYQVPLIAGLLVYTVASLLCALSTSIDGLVIVWLVRGLAGGVGLVIMQSAGPAPG